MHASETTINKTHSIPSQLLREQTCEMLRSFSPTISWTEKKKKTPKFVARHVSPGPTKWQKIIKHALTRNSG